MKLSSSANTTLRLHIRR